MAMFDLKVRLIPDSTELKKALKNNQMNAFGNAAKSAAKGAAGDAGGSALTGEVSVKGFGKLLGSIAAILATADAISFIVVPVMTMIKAIIALLFLPIVPILKVFLSTNCFINRKICN